MLYSTQKVSDLETSLMFRIAATGVCEKVASSFDCSIGEEIGYHIGGNKKTSGMTSVKFVTERILLNEMIIDNEISKYSNILIDEAHERHNDTDILLGRLYEIIKVRKDIKVVVMSATIDVKKFAAYFNTRASRFLIQLSKSCSS